MLLLYYCSGLPFQFGNHRVELLWSSLHLAKSSIQPQGWRCTSSSRWMNILMNCISENHAPGAITAAWCSMDFLVFVHNCNFKAKTYIVTTNTMKECEASLSKKEKSTYLCDIKTDQHFVNTRG